MKRTGRSNRTFTLFGYLIGYSIADTIWVRTSGEATDLGSRDDYMIKLSRLYLRSYKAYMWTLIIGKLNIKWAKL